MSRTWNYGEVANTFKWPSESRSSLLERNENEKIRKHNNKLDLEPRKLENTIHVLGEKLYYAPGIDNLPTDLFIV